MVHFAEITEAFQIEFKHERTWGGGGGKGGRVIFDKIVPELSSEESYRIVRL